MVVPVVLAFPAERRHGRTRFSETGQLPRRPRRQLYCHRACQQKAYRQRGERPSGTPEPSADARRNHRPELKLVMITGARPLDETQAGVFGAWPAGTGTYTAPGTCILGGMSADEAGRPMPSGLGFAGQWTIRGVRLRNCLHTKTVMTRSVR